MRFKNSILIITFLSLISLSRAQTRESLLLQTDWKFHLGAADNAWQEEYDDSEWEQVKIPHDWAVKQDFIPDGNGSTGKLPWKDEGWYRKELNIPENYSEKNVYLLFDGVMAFPVVWINGKSAGKWDYGYNSFYLEITPFLKPGGKNILAVHANTRNHGSRWYPGGGIYRKVQMIVVDPLHIDIWGNYITTPIIKPHYADVRISTSLINNYEEDKEVTIKNRIFTAENNEVGVDEIKGKIGAGEKQNFEVTITLIDPRRWDLDDPHLYKVITEIYYGDKLADRYLSKFGVREMVFTADNGFFLNNKKVQLKGVNLHHDHGPLGAAFYRRAMERQLEIMKDMGCNAIRTSHNVAAPELLDLCDEMGFLVYDEAFDKWDRKADITDTTDFNLYMERNIRNFIRRDRNHPSVFIWSVGNEMRDIQMNEHNGFQKLHHAVNLVRKYDPTRPVTMACDIFNSAELRHFDYYDVHSYNYSRRYWLAHQLEPNKSVIISESASTVSTRGYYEFPLPEKKTDFSRTLQVSSYDLNTPWWAEVPDDDFMWQQEEPYVAGEFVWTGFDYLGEPTPYSDWMLIKEFGLTSREESRSSYFGIVDLVGIPKDRFYLYRSYWNDEDVTLHILPHWNWEERIGEITPVFVYTSGDCAELFLNGKSLGKKCKNPKSEKSIERFRLMWDDVSYEPGELKAIAYKAGVKIGEKTRVTASKAHRLKLTPDHSQLSSNGNDLSYILVEAVDKNGNPCPLADNLVKIKVQGPGKIAGVGNGNPQSLNSFQSESIPLFYGKAMIIVLSGMENGEMLITAESKGLEKAEVRLKAE